MFNMDELESFQTNTNARASAAWNELPSLESPFSELEEMEPASELLNVTNETELERVLGGLLRKAATAAGGSLNSSTGRALGGLLKGTIKKALPPDPPISTPQDFFPPRMVRPRLKALLCSRKAACIDVASSDFLYSENDGN